MEMSSYVVYNRPSCMSTQNLLVVVLLL